MGLHFMLGGLMDAHLIGIEVTQLLLKLKAPAEKPRPIKPEKAAAGPAVSSRETYISTQR